MKKKKCSKCGKPKILDEFGKQTNAKDSHRSECKLCCNEAMAKYRENNKEHVQNLQSANYKLNKTKIVKRAKTWAASHKEKCLAVSQKTRKVTRWHVTLASRSRTVAKMKNLDHNIDADHIMSLFKSQNGKCYWLGVPMVPSIEWRNPYQPSLDRLDRTKGYVKSNVVLSIQFANLGRSTQTAEEFKSFLKGIWIVA